MTPTCTGTLQNGQPCTHRARVDTDPPRCGVHLADRLDSRKGAAVLERIANALSVSDACAATGVPRSTFYQWVNTDPSFAAAVADAREQAADHLEAVLYDRAVNGVSEPVYNKNGEHVGDRTRYSDGAAYFLLKGLRPATYRERYEVSGQLDHEHRHVIDFEESRRNVLDALDAAERAIEAESRPAE